MCSKKEELNDFLNDFNMKLASVTFEFKYSKEKIDFFLPTTSGRQNYSHSISGHPYALKKREQITIKPHS